MKNCNSPNPEIYLWDLFQRWEPSTTINFFWRRDSIHPFSVHFISCFNVAAVPFRCEDRPPQRQRGQPLRRSPQCSLIPTWLRSPEGESPRRPFPSCSRPGGRSDNAFCTSSLDGSPSRLETCSEEEEEEEDRKKGRVVYGSCAQSWMRIRKQKLCL